MSEQTPNSNGGMTDGGEPSMEDILASIRKIISDDEVVAMESPEDSASLDVQDLTSDAELSVAEFEAQSDELTDMASEFNDGESVDLEIGSILAEVETVTPPADGEKDLNPLDIVLAAPVAAPDVPVLENDDDVLDMLDMEIPMMDDTPDVSPTAAALGGVGALSAVALTTKAKVAEVVPDEIQVNDTNDIDEMDALLDDILADDEDLDDTFDAASELPKTVDTDPDLELVKSLMADLSDEDAGDVVGTDDELDALLAIPELPEIIDDPAPELAADDGEDDDILGDILDMTLDDEIADHPDELDVTDFDSAEAVQAAELDNVAENTAPSLSDIAKSAEAEADAMSAPNPIAATIGLTAVGAGAAALGATALGQEPLSENKTTQTESVNPTSEQPLEETSMPVAAVSNDAILDDVTEAAAAGAFASLNQAVEDKAIVAERGDRIGDLVMEALRPMLKDWLDANLKGIVERAVSKEVKRISSGK